MKGIKKTGLIGLLAIIGLFTTQAQAYDLVKRMKLMDDRFKTQDMLRPFGHDFLLDITAAANSDTQSLLDDVDKIGSLTGTTQEQVNQADAILAKHYNTEKYLRLRLGLGMPIFSFSAFGIRWRPNLRLDAGLAALINVKSENVTYTSLVNNLDQIPAELRTALIACNPTQPPLNDGDDILAFCVNNGSITQLQADLVKSTYGITKIPYLNSIVASSSNLPVFDNYIKIDAKAGMVMDYTKDEHWFGQFSLLALGRADLRKKLDATLMIAGGGDIDIGEPNTQVNAVFDYKLGYKNSNYSVFAALEEVKIAEVKSETTKPVYGTDPLIRLHGQANYRLWIFSAQPFLGTHARSGYGFGDAYYFGADWGAHVWGDRLGITLRTMADKEHFTFATRFKLWLMHLEVMAKTPLATQVDGVKVSEIYSADLRFFF
ncbi:MAG: hypothetical protein HYV97_08345 [Bdellovibrio sp.]|nr:hypothetical protein [Bdellovibrio sp.]